MCSCSRDGNTVELVARNENVRQVILQDELNEVIARRGQRPAVFLVMLHDKAVTLGNLFEALVMVGVASAGILDSVDMAVVMDHLMQKRGADILDGPCQCSRADVDFVAVAGNRYPSIIPHREVTVGAGRGLNRDGRPYKCIFKIVVVQEVKELVQVTSNTVIRSQLFHSPFLLIR